MGEKSSILAKKLVDRDIPSKGHRTVLMQEDWEYLGCLSPKKDFLENNKVRTSPDS